MATAKRVSSEKSSSFSKGSPSRERSVLWDARRKRPSQSRQPYCIFYSPQALPFFFLFFPLLPLLLFTVQLPKLVSTSPPLASSLNPAAPAAPTRRRFKILNSSLFIVHFGGISLSSFPFCGPRLKGFRGGECEGRERHPLLSSE